MYVCNGCESHLLQPLGKRVETGSSYVSTCELVCVVVCTVCVCSCVYNMCRLVIDKSSLYPFRVHSSSCMLTQLAYLSATWIIPVQRLKANGVLLLLLE